MLTNDIISFEQLGPGVLQYNEESLQNSSGSVSHVVRSSDERRKYCEINL